MNSGSWWWTGRPGVLRFMGSQSRTWLSDWTELNRTEWMWKLPQKQKHLKHLNKEFLLYNFAHTLFWTISTTSLLLISICNLISPRSVFPTLAFYSLHRKSSHLLELAFGWPINILKPFTSIEMIWTGEQVDITNLHLEILSLKCLWVIQMQAPTDG